VKKQETRGALEGRVALVTGANRGIGAAIARGLAREGALVLLGHRAAGSADAIAAEIRAAGGRAEPLRIDVAEEASVAAAARDVESRWKALHVLVNNAGILEDDGFRTEDLPLEVFERTIRVNLRGALLTTQAFLPLMRRGRWGRIVNLTSGLGLLSDGMSGGYPAYRMSKAALNALTANLASEVARDGILVNAVDPGWVRTDMGGPSAPDTPEEGADTAIWAATLPDDGPSGKVLADREVTAF
jgi:NAD(P)-dependent dehydrogenase (short-subunit alcohol dehydrogenase family)